MNATSLIDPAALMRVKSLELRARMVMEGFWKGLHKSPYHGFSVEFSEYRPYVRGDDPRFIDWKVMARSDRAFIKKFEDETNLRAHLLVDRSKSMAYGSGDFSKSDYAATLAATLGYFLMGQNDAVGLTTFDEKVDQHIPARNRPGQLRRLMLNLESAPSGHGTDLGAAMKGLHEIIQKRSLILLLSDLLAPLEELETQIGYLAAGRHDLAVFQILDPREIDFDFSKATHFRDSETGRDLYIDPDKARADYLDRFAAHQEAVRAMCARHGVSHRLIPTDEPLEEVMFEFVTHRSA
ncbi:MAG: DUF58 domain-containing protein [Verrucomicrobiales bacterium]|jgi:uncharacterized protein (DUF58 family)|nr:DUF58 domain-containing protein [Verrucomicrobiales bacterium]